MLILHLFGNTAALERWALEQVVVTPRATSRSLSLSRGEARITFAEGIRIAGGTLVEVRGVVIRDPFDLDKLVGTEPTMVIQDDSFLAIAGRVDLIGRIYPYVR